MGRIFRSDSHDSPAHPLLRDALKEFPNELPLEEEIEEAPTITPEMVEEMRAEMLAQLRAETQEQVRQAHAQAYEKGFAAGREAFDETVAQAGALLLQSGAAMAQAHQELLDSLEPQVVALVQQIGRCVLQRELKTDPELIHQTVRRALSRITDRARIRLYVNPGDLAALREHRVRMFEDFDGVEELELHVDETLQPGSCRADSALMHVEADMDQLLEDVLAAMDDAERGAAERPAQQTAALDMPPEAEAPEAEAPEAETEPEEQ